MTQRAKRLWEQGIGYSIVVIGVWVTLHTLINWRTVPVAFIQVKKEVVKLVPVQPPEDPHIGPSRVVNMWHSAEKGYEDIPDGDYQFEDSHGLVQTLHFCDQPPPVFKVDRIIEVHFQYMSSFSKDKCVHFTWAQILENK